ncbi:MAG: hypothetical protein K2I08_10810, partial [Muribaculaceae bacterium]|nr:hypothetical protein [Muribaculaceae bacterium]
MKQIISSLLLVLMLCGVSSCKNELDALEDGNHRILKKEEKPMLKTIRLSFGGDCISESEEPLMRADDSFTYIAINVFCTPTTVTNADQERYAYGLFRSTEIPENISVELLTGYKYDFEATILIEGLDKVFIEGLDKLQSDAVYGEPFVISTKKESNVRSFGGYPTDSLNRFIYSYKQYSIEQLNREENRNYFRLLHSGFALVDPQGDNDESCYRNPRVKRYYGKTTGFELSSSTSEKVKLDMEYKCFGLQINITGMSGGTLTVEDKSYHSSIDLNKPQLYLDKLIFPKNLEFTKDDINKEDPWECIYSMNDFNAESETFNLEFNWDKGYGIIKT